jgi:phage terminase large subunit-like protein
MFSTAGDQSSTTMIKLREQALTAIDRQETSGLYWCEWSPPPGIDPNDRQWWPWANPALGTTVTLEALELAFATPDRMAFMRAHLNCWVSAAQAWLPLGRWDQLQTDQPVPAGGWLALESNMDDSRFIGIRASQHDNKIITDVAFAVDTVSDIWPQVIDLMRDPTLQLSVPPNLEPHVPHDLRRRTIISGYRELKPLTPLVRALILEGRVLHLGNTAMSEHVNRAVQTKLPDGAPLTTQKSPGPIELARAMVIAVGNASKPKTNTRAAFASAR